MRSIPPGELPPPPPRACFGRNELIEEIIDLAENLTPIALIGAGGIGKTSIALTVLHHDRTRQRFGNDRRFIRCDQFLTSRTHFLNRLSKVIGAGIENPDDLAPLRPFLSSKEMFIILDNAESILDPQGTNAREIYTVVEELSRFQTVCLCITSRISTVPQHCQRPIIPTLSMESACDILYGIHKNGGQSNIISNLLRQLDFHPLSITLLATAASHNMWDFDRLAQEWDAHRVRILQVDCNESLATTIELSLASPTFRELGPDARDILGVVAFFPQGINENNADWLLPTTSGRRNIFDKFCVLSLTHRSNGFITMLAPLRDYLRPKDPASSTLLRITKESYFSRLSVRVEPDKPGFEKAQWITSEDLNIEHLLDVFTSIDVHSVGVWTACANFMRHLYWFKKRLVVLGSKIEGLPDDHPSKPSCLSELSRLFDSTGNRIESRRLLTHALKLWRERGDDLQVAHTLRFLADANRLLGLHKEGIQRVEEALGIYEQFNDISGQAHSLQYLAWLLHDDNQLDAAKEAASRVIDLLPNKGEQFLVCRCHRVLGLICLSKGETEEAITHFETALGIASPFSWHSEQFWNHHSLARLFSKRGRFKDAHAHVERAKSHAIDAPYLLGRAVRLQARIWYKERRFEEAKSGALRAAGIYEKIGAVEEVEHCRAVLRDVEEKMKKSVTSGGSNFNSELLRTMLLPIPANSISSAQGTRRHHKRTLPQITDLASGQAYNS